MRRRLTLTICAIALHACGFEPPPPIADDGGAIDAAEPDALVLDCEPDTIVCDDAEGRYVECGSDGTSTRVIDCPLGCATTAEKCVDVAPSNGLAGYLDQARDDATVRDVTFAGSSTIDTDSGVIMNGDIPLDIATSVTNGIRVYMFKNLSIQGTVKVTGTMPIAFVADGNVEITGIIDVSADMYTSGPGGVTSGACIGGDIAGAQNNIPGGGGGGRFQPGGRGGNAYNGASGGAAGAARPEPTIEPLVGGCRGGEARYLVFPTPPPNGGGGGGALQISATGRIELTATGKIDASGGGGSGPGPGPGGGAGGAVLLEAPIIVLDGPGVVISTKGGGGGGARGSTAAPGADGGTDPEPAAGGSLSGYAAGGAGGTEAAAPQDGGTGNATNTHGAGAGGSVGETRFNTQTASVMPDNGAAIRSRFTIGSVGTRLIP